MSSTSAIATDSLADRFRIARRADIKPLPMRPSTKYLDDIRHRPHARPTGRPRPQSLAAQDEHNCATGELPAGVLQPRVAGHVTIDPISLALDAGSDQSKSKRKLRYSLYDGNHKTHLRLLSLMATGVFAFGMFVSIQGWLLNRRVGQSLPVAHAESQTALPDETKPADDELAQYQVAADMPRYLSIESQGIKARVFRMGLTNEGAVATPNNVHDTGWYEGSAKPGDSGISLIVGHVSGISSPGVFGKLSQLQAGDTITIERGDGKILKYRVAGSESFPADNVDMTKVLSHTSGGQETLNLITCHGSYSLASHQYNERLVVYTTRI